MEIDQIQKALLFNFDNATVLYLNRQIQKGHKDIHSSHVGDSHHVLCSFPEINSLAHSTLVYLSSPYGQLTSSDGSIVFGSWWSVGTFSLF
jgi:hypothetical protein